MKLKKLYLRLIVAPLALNRIVTKLHIFIEYLFKVDREVSQTHPCLLLITLFLNHLSLCVGLGVECQAFG